jgi:type IV pilus assembly protein PilF
MRVDRVWRRKAIPLLLALLLPALLACGGGQKKAVAKSRATAHFQLSVRYFQQGGVRAALQEVTKAVDLEKKNTDYLAFMGLVQFSLGQYLLAEESLLKVLELNPAITDTHVTLAMVYSETERYDDARDHYRIALGDPAYLTPEKAYINWGLTELKQGDEINAESLFREALEVSPRYPRAHWELGRLLESQGHASKALAEYLEAWKTGMSEFPVLNLKLGELYLARGEQAEAQIYLEKVIGVSPDSPEAETSRRLLGGINTE